LTSDRKRELWEQPIQACATGAVKPDGQNSVISFVVSKCLFPDSLGCRPLVKGNEESENGIGDKVYLCPCVMQVDIPERIRSPLWLQKVLETIASRLDYSRMLILNQCNEIFWVRLIVIVYDKN